MSEAPWGMVWGLGQARQKFCSSSPVFAELLQLLPSRRGPSGLQRGPWAPTAEILKGF